MKSKSVKQKLVTKSLELLVTSLKRKPKSQRKAIVHRVARLLLLLSKKTRRRAIANIRRAMPGLSLIAVKELAFEAYANCAYGVAESFWLEQLEPEIFCDESTLQILQSGQGACIATMHLGCYEAVPLAIKKFAGQSVTMTDVPNFIEDGLQFYANAEIIAIDKKSPSAFTDLLKHAKNNAYISLHCDLWANEAEVEFFKQKTKAPAGIALLAAMTRQPLLLGYAVYREDGQIQVFFETIHSNTSIINVQDDRPIAEQLMEKIYLRFEQIIRQYPEQWYWSYKRWR